MRFFYCQISFILFHISLKLRGTMQSSIGGIINIPYDNIDCKDFIESTQHPIEGGFEFQFKTPNHPKNYSKNLNCIKIIEAPRDHDIFLSIRGIFDLEPHDMCTHDFLEIRDGKYGFSPTFGTFCSSKTKLFERIRSTQNYMWIRFHSDNSIERSGFIASYTFQKQKQKYSPKRIRDSHSFNLEDSNILIQDPLLKEFLVDLKNEQKVLPLESVLEFKCPKNFLVAMHVHNFTVPKDYKWSCKPDVIKGLEDIGHCRSGDPVTLKRFKRSNFEAKDESEIKQTYLEIYNENTISGYSIPCPRIQRLCSHENITSPIISESNIMILRILVSSPIHGPPSTASNSVADMYPKIAFNLICLRNSDNGNCPESYKVCDKNCILEKFFCNEDFACKKSEDDNKYCKEDGKQNLHEFVDGTKEVQNEKMTTLTIHMSILGIIAFLLLTITASCFIIAFRSKAKQNQANEKIVIPIELKDTTDTSESEVLIKSRNAQNYQILEESKNLSKNSYLLSDYPEELVHPLYNNRKLSTSHEFLENLSEPKFYKVKKADILEKMQREFSQDVFNDDCQQMKQEFYLTDSSIDTNGDRNKKNWRHLQNSNAQNLFFKYQNSFDLNNSSQSENKDDENGKQQEDFINHKINSQAFQLKTFQPNIKMIPINQEIISDDVLSDEDYSQKSSSTNSNIFNHNSMMEKYFENLHNIDELNDAIHFSESERSNNESYTECADEDFNGPKNFMHNKDSSLLNKRTMYNIKNDLPSRSSPSNLSKTRSPFKKYSPNHSIKHLDNCLSNDAYMNSTSSSNFLSPSLLVRTISCKNVKNKNAHVKEYIA